jgi:transcriptional regulator with XRE-family HTH domain
MYKRPDELFGMSVKDIARVARVDPSTARRWKRGTSPVPAGMLLLLCGDLGSLDPAWSGWVIRQGLLCSPENWTCTPGHVRAMQLHHAQVRELRRANLLLRAELDALEGKAPWLDEQPTPDQWEFKSG